MNTFLAAFVSETCTDEVERWYRGTSCWGPPTTRRDEAMKWLGIVVVTALCAACGGSNPSQEQPPADAAPGAANAPSDAGAPAEPAAPRAEAAPPAPPAPTFRDITLP